MNCRKGAPDITPLSLAMPLFTPNPLPVFGTLCTALLSKHLIVASVLFQFHRVRFGGKVINKAGCGARCFELSYVLPDPAPVKGVWRH